MSVADTYRDTGRGALRVLFCIGVRDAFFAAEAQERKAVFTAINEAFADLHGRFGVRVLGTMDDDELVVGPADGYPWTAYILADVPDYELVTRVCDIVRSTEVGTAKLWKYLKIEARIGRPLFFGNE
ncbi:hypothetical protein [Amycolatopsis cihanbeyliensis]|uniref:IacB protein n=1 Tax=Amycolatopsis cihanbeyliensis TaxID=1128664 RepID=A0A542DR65_AMYCI|nr:hypothetical protein [Amycolatopsis cihanbeyliensis]TQJ05589.1 hypothetical protein FB471_5426 [Amycolatopsis cihanbeyliensis]